LCDRTRRR